MRPTHVDSVHPELGTKADVAGSLTGMLLHSKEPGLNIQDTSLAQ